MNFKITQIGIYKNKQKVTQPIHTPMICFHVRGQNQLKVFTDYGEIDYGRKTLPPYFSITVPGMTVESNFESNRENWVIIMISDDFRLSRRQGFIEIFDEKKWIQLPIVSFLPEERVSGWQVELQRMKQCFSYPQPRNLFRVKLGTMNILRHLIDQQSDSLGVSPAFQLKKLIDEDSTFRYNISELSTQCDYDHDYLRLTFQKEFAINPGIYRNRLRMTRAMELISNSKLSVKEISYKLGFKYLTHFHKLFQTEYGITPGDGIKKFRYRK